MDVELTPYENTQGGDHHDDLEDRISLNYFFGRNKKP